jgi:hypothetical protein
MERSVNKGAINQGIALRGGIVLNEIVDTQGKEKDGEKGWQGDEDAICETMKEVAKRVEGVGE